MELNFKREWLDKFLETAIERHKIYIKRESGQQKPWTDDDIFKDYFFCNVFRQYDKCSKWIIENIIPFERWDMLILYRFISTFELFEEIKENCKLYDFKTIHLFLKDKREIGDRLFSSCFIRSPGIKGGWTETYNVPFFLMEEIKEDGRIQEFIEKQSLELMVEYLSNFSGTQGFMGYEYACDFEYTSWFNPVDKYTWCNKGPGAQKGLSLLLHENSKVKIPAKTWEKEISTLFAIMKKEFNNIFPNEDFSMREVEHWLCEFQKYIKYLSMKNGEGFAKHRKYDGVE
jgi:hypothetical protein